AALRALSTDDAGLRSEAGKLKARRLRVRVCEMAADLWPGTGAPPLSDDWMDRIYGAALRGEMPT
ncbi:MAG: hypothetical protein WAT93_04220, partial [Pontixanthobacter sp.]